MTNARTMLAAALAMTTAACGGAGGGGGAAGIDPIAWARDTCKTFPLAAAAKASGLPVTKAEPGMSSEVDGAANSSCQYSDGGKANFNVALRAGDNQTAASQIESMKQHPDDVGPMEDVAVATGQARWLPKLHEILYYPDDRRMVMVVSPGFRMFGTSDSEADQKKQALAIALAAAG